MLKTGRLNKEAALDEMTPEDLKNFWLLYQLEPFCTRGEERRLGRAAESISNRPWYEIFPGHEGENAPRKRERTPEEEKANLDAVLAHWKLQAEIWNKSQGL